MLTILIVDDEYLVRIGIRNTIDWSNYGVEIIGEVGDGEEGLELAEKYQPDIIITDIRMPFMNGLEFMEKLREHKISSKIIVLSGYNDFEYVRTAVRNGASDYLLKPIENQQLIDTVLKVSKDIINDREKQKYYEKLEDELPNVKNQFLYDVISGNLQDEKTIKEKMEFLHIPLDFKNNYILIIKVDNIDNTNMEIPNKNQDEIRKIISDQIDSIYFKNGFSGLFMEYHVNEWVIILHSIDNSVYDIQNINNRCAEFISDMEKYWTGVISIGISNLCSNITDIENSYQAAYKALEKNYMPGQNSICYVGDESLGCRKEIKHALEYMKKHYNEDITVEKVAQELYLSPSHLMHLFKSEMKKTFNDCLINLRIEAAKYLLKDPRYKIYEVAEKVGYKDAKYFSQLFRKVTGKNPSNYMD